jgi:phage repressor protein C with HTH and peptisase S24 domain
MFDDIYNMFDKINMENILPGINQRIKDLIQEKYKGNVTQCAKDLGYNSPQKLNRLFSIDPRMTDEDKKKHKYPTPSTDMLTEISNAFDVSLDYLIKGITSQMKTENHVPFYESDVTGSLVGSFDDIKENPSFYVDFKPFNDCIAYFPIYGDSMYPKFSSGEIIAVKEVLNRNTLQWGEAYLVITDATENNMRTVKTVHPCDDDPNCLILRAANPEYRGDTKVRKEAILNMYLVKGKIRKDQI